MMNELPIDDIRVRKIIDSRGNFTVEVDLFIEDVMGRCSAPSGASTGDTEMKAFPKSGPDGAIKFFEEKLRSKLIGYNAMDQTGFDRTIMETDGSEYMENVGGNLSTALSVANARAVASYLGIPLYSYVGGAFARSLPRPMGNVIGGGKHSKEGTTIQEFLVSAQADTFIQSAYINAMTHRRIGEILSEKLKGTSVGLGDEKAWTANISDEEALEIMHQAVSETSSRYHVRILKGVDFAANSFYGGGKYIYKDGPKTRDQQIDYAVSFSRDHDFYFIEDPMVDTDFDGFAEITKKISQKNLVVGDDLYTTNPERLKMGIEKKSTNGILIKVNQIGSLSRTAETVRLATAAGIRNTVSHRSGETTDDFAAHLSVAFGSIFIKTGTIGGERLAKLNELIRIEEEINSN